MYERTCCEIPNAITATERATTSKSTKTETATVQTRRTRKAVARETYNENNEHKCRCQRNFQSRTHHSSIATASSTCKSNRNRKPPIQTNVNMQQLQRSQHQNEQEHQHQHQEQSPDHLLHLAMTSESASSFMESGFTASSSETNIVNRCSSPVSPLSTSSFSSSDSSMTTATGAHTTPSLGVNLRVTGQCSQGGRKYMEDYFSVAYQHSENAKDLEYAFFGIFDGHGGAEAATFAKEHLMMEIINQKLFWSDSDQDVLRAIREGYIATHFAMWREQDKWPKTANGLPSTAGTTATVAFIRHEKIYIGHVGDSGIVLGYQNDGEKWWRAKQLTTDHKPESMAERARIMRSGGKVVVKSGVPRVVWNRPRNSGHRGPIRHNTPIDEIPFLAVARSLGDLWSYNSLCNEFVVSPDPDVRVIKINPKTFRCLIFGTDGLWNVVTPQEAVNTVFHNEMVNERLQRQRGENLSNGNGWMNPSKVLVDRALSTWSAKKMRADNTSVVTVILHPPNNSGSSNNSGVMDNINSASKMEDCMSDNFGIEYSQISANYMNTMNNDETITYREMADKYLPPEEYRNFNYYEDSVECNGVSVSNKSYYDERYAKLSGNASRYSLPNTIEALEYSCGNKEQMDRLAACDLNDSDKVSADAEMETPIEIRTVNGNDAVDDEDCDDDEDDDENEFNEDDNGGSLSDVANESDVLGLNNYTSHYLRDQNEISQPTNAFEINGGGVGVGGVDEATTSSYMSTFTESYNTLLGGDSVVSDAHMASDVSTSNSSSSYKSHSATCIQELVQEQQRYQQQCMSEEEGYSLTKLETRREQQRCNTSGVQTFRIFQQQQEHQQQQDDNDVPKSSSDQSDISCHENYMWEPRFPSAFSGSSQRYQSYQNQQQTQHQQQQQFMLEQQLKSLELNSLLQQEREEEQQVELERQMEMERFQQQQSLQSNPQHERHSEAFGKSEKATSDFLLVHGNDNASSEVLTPICVDTGEDPDTDISIDEEYLLLDEDVETNDPSVQINEISSSSSLLESDVPTEASKSTSRYLDKLNSSTSNTSTLLLFTPLPSSSTSGERVFVDVFETTSDSSYESTIDEIKDAPKIIEKLEKIEILREKPELVIETAPTTSMSTRSRHKLNLSITTPSKRRCRSNVAARQHFPNIPNENQHEVMQPTKTVHTSLKNGILQLTPVNASEAQSFYSKRQLRSASSSSNSSSNGVIGNVSQIRSNSNCDIRASKRKSCFHSSSPLSSSIDYVKRTLRTRNSLAKDMKAKTNLLSSSLKRSSSTSTTRFLRGQSSNFLNIHQSTQAIGSNCKKSTPALPNQPIISSTCITRKGTQQVQQQQQQRPLTTATINFINLRSRQIFGTGSSSSVNSSSSSTSSTSIIGLPEQRLQTATTSSVLSRSQVRNLTANNTPTVAMNTSQTYVRRNLRSLTTLRSCVKGKVTVSTSTTGLTNYCKSMRSQSVTALVTPPPPSPKHLNPSAANVTFAVTRARTANLIPSSVSPTNSLLLNGTIGLHGSRKRSIRTTESNEQDVAPILMATRAQKRLRR